ncbi:MAG TPA: hypothetical protein VHQ70_09755 [Syntrophomonadaceae bacterium]|nr:hypothetical protein [Syntrophomonadaceae bacterium]
MVEKDRTTSDIEKLKFEVGQEMGLVNKENKQKIKGHENTS